MLYLDGQQVKILNLDMPIIIQPSRRGVPVASEPCLPPPLRLPHWRCTSTTAPSVETRAAEQVGRRPRDASSTSRTSRWATISTVLAEWLAVSRLCPPCRHTLPMHRGCALRSRSDSGFNQVLCAVGNGRCLLVSSTTMMYKFKRYYFTM